MAQPDPPTMEEWRAEVSGLCDDAVQETTALPLPASPAESATDAAAQVEILSMVRDRMLQLGVPEERDADVRAYIDQLRADIDLLVEIQRTGEQGLDAAPLRAELDEESGALAESLDLPNCVALANAIARTP